jgi:flagellar hook-associated protein 1
MGSMLNLTLEVARRTLLNSGTAIETISHNIANADNKAYARQKVLFATNLPHEISSGWLGTGARVTRIVQQRDQFIEHRLLGSKSKESGYDTLVSHLTTLESLLFDDGEYGISQTLAEFWDAWERLSQNPSGLAEKSLVYESSQNIASTLRQTYNNAVEYASGIVPEMEHTATEVNDLLTRIAQSNRQIKINEVGGHPANDLRDLRYADLSKLSELIPISWQEDDLGALTISIDTSDGDGGIISVHLVEGSHAGYLKIVEDENNYPQIMVSSKSDYINDPGFTESPLADLDELSGGRLPALKNIYDKFGVQAQDFNSVLADPLNPGLSYLDRLNLFAYTLLKEVNGAYGAEGKNVFSEVVSVADFSAVQIAVDSAFTIEEIDPSTALGIVDLQKESFPSLGEADFSQYLADIQMQLGRELQFASAQNEFHRALATQLQGQQQSASGVSID